MEIEAIKKIQSEGILEMENLGRGTETIDVSITNRIQDRENLRCRRYNRKKLIKQSKKMLSLNSFWHKSLGNLGYYEKTKPKNNRRFPAQGPRTYF